MRPFNDVDLHAFVDDQISPDRRNAVAAYLVTAPEEAARVEGWRKQNATIRALLAPPAAEPVPLWLTVGQILSTRTGPDDRGRPTEKTPSPRSKLRKRTTSPARSPWSIAAVAFVAGLILATSIEHASRFLPSSVAGAAELRGFRQRAWEAHDTFALDPDHPVDVADVPPGRLQAWLDTRVPFQMKIPDLRSDGWALLGARLAPNDAGPGALLVYRNGAGERLSLFAGRTAAEEANLDAPAMDDHGQLVWSDGSTAYAWMSPKGADWLQRHKAALTQAVLTLGAD